MKLIYLASPYSHPDPLTEDLRYAQVLDFVYITRNDYELIYSPIVYWYPIVRTYNMPGDALTFKKLNETMMGKSDEIWVYTLPGWAESKGVKMEIRWALACEKNVRYIEPL